VTDWIAVGGSSTWGTCWVADMGYWSGPDLMEVQTRPSDAAQVDYWLAVLGAGGVESGSIVGPYAFAQRFLMPDGTEASLTTSGAVTDSGVDVSMARLYVAWFDPGYPADPASMAAPSVSPDALIPAGWISSTPPTPAPPPPPPAEARPVASLYDVDGTFLTELPLAAGIQWQDETSAPGALSLRLPLDDAATAQATSRRILKVHWRGKFRQAARIDSSSTVVAVDGRMWREWSNLPGVLALLGGVPVYPEYGLDRTSNSQRTIGYMSRYGHGVWLESANFTSAVGVAWSAMTGVRAALPDGLDFPDPQWISKRGPNHVEPANSYQYFRRIFPTFQSRSVQILATAENFLDLWLDGEQIVSSDGQDPTTWRQAFQVAMTLQPSPEGGRHTIAARVRNRRHVDSPLRMLFTMQEVDEAGNVLEQPPIINSDSDWDVSDVVPGFRRAEALVRLWTEGDFYGYSAPGLIRLGFSVDTDSAGSVWEDEPAEYTIDVGSSVLDLLATFTEKDIDASIDPDTLRLHLWNRRGTDKTNSVTLALGRDGGNLIDHRVDRVEPTFNTVLLQVKDGRWMQRQDTGAVTVNGREGAGIAVGSTSDAGSAYQVADAQLADAAQPTITFTSQVSSQIGPQIYVDYDLGDTITVPNEDGTAGYAARVMAVTVDAPDDGSPVRITPELMLDRSATPAPYDSGGDGVDDPGDLESPDQPQGGGGGTDPSDPTDVPPSEGDVPGMITVPNPGAFPSDHPISNFTVLANTAGLVPPAVLAGSGATQTGYYLAPHSSTQAAKVPPQSAEPKTNPLTVLVQGGNDSAHVVSGIDWGGFAVVGTDQGHLYNGVRIGYSSAPHIHDFFIGGIPGDDNAPPGETFSLNLWHAPNALIEGGVIDGRNQAGVPVAASLIGLNNADNVTVRLTTANYANSGIGFTGWKSRNITVTDCNFSRNRRALNFEQCGGFINLTRVDMTNQVRTSQHVSCNSNLGSAKLTITDPIVEFPLRILAGAESVPQYDKKPNLQKRSDVKVIVGGVDVTHDPAYVHFI
jgi:hypothetical protein